MTRFNPLWVSGITVTFLIFTPFAVTEEEVLQFLEDYLPVLQDYDVRSNPTSSPLQVKCHYCLSMALYNIQ